MNRLRFTLCLILLAVGVKHNLVSAENTNALTQPERISICVDDADWMPFIYRSDSQLKGLHIIIVSKALKALNIHHNTHLVPWKRCLKGLEKGTYDAVISASYNEDRAQFLLYPEDADKDLHSQWRVTQVEYVIALPKQSTFVYDGNPKLIPKPVRIPRGFSIVDELRNLGVEVDDSSLNDDQNIKRLYREQTGSVVTLPSIVDWYNQQEMYKNAMKTDPTTLRSKSYFFAFSKKGQVSRKVSQRIWERIKIERENLLSTPESVEQIATDSQG